MHSLKYLLEKCSRILLCWIAMYGLMTNEVPYVLSGLTVHLFSTCINSYNGNSEVTINVIKML